MPTHDIVADFGAVADCRRVTVTGSITTGASPVFSPATNIFAANGGDPTGKCIYLNASGFIYPDGAIIAARVSSYNSGTGAVTLDTANPTVQTSVSMDVLWGTETRTALTAWNTWALGQVGQTILTWPAGHFFVDFNPFYLPNANLPDVKWVGAGSGSTTISMGVPSEMRFGGDPPTASKGLTTGGNSARLITTTAGASFVTLSDPTGFSSKITVGRWCLIGGYDMQGNGSGLTGYPTNLAFYEYNKITAYNSTVGDPDYGKVTLLNPLAQVYKSTWPKWTGDQSFHPDLGGPATIWVAPANYDATVELNDMTVDSPYNQSTILCHDAIVRRVVNIGPGIYPSQCNNFTADTTNYSSSLEIDKLVVNATFIDCTINILQFQSATPKFLTVTRGTLNQSNGLARNNVLDGVAFGGAGRLQVGCSSYGETASANIQNCTGITLFERAGGDTGDVGSNATTFYTFSGGVMSFPKSANTGTGGRANPSRLFVPGAWLFFDDKYLDQVVDVYEDGTNCYIQWAKTTDWPFTPVIKFIAHPCPDLTMRNCTGTAPELEDYNQASARIPFGSYSKRTYVAGASAATALPIAQRVTVFGKLVSVKSTVTSLYTGASLTFNLTQFSNGRYSRQSDYTLISDFGEAINMKAGLNTPRILNNAASGTGALSGDTLYDFTSNGSVWFNLQPNSSPVFSANVSNGDTPTITVEWIMDQGIPSAVPAAVMPLRFRLHA